MLELPHGLRPGGRFAEWTATPPRYLVADVDGTLLAESHVPTQAVLEAAAACGPAGLRVGVATGRMPHAVADLIARLGAEGPHVVHNGAEVWADGAILEAWPLPPQARAVLRDLCAGHGLYAEFYAGDGYWVTDRRREAQRHWELLRRDPDGDAGALDLARTEVLKATVILFSGDDPAPVLATLAEAGLTCGAGSSPENRI
ncbi:MAG TPA: HAD hydrolase family protein, partial [Egibacteraceae bacterium]|nr:HAD hydrolase family protein [Egibacteraceae bacterium]